MLANSESFTVVVGVLGLGVSHLNQSEHQDMFADQ